MCAHHWVGGPWGGGNACRSCRKFKYRTGHKADSHTCMYGRSGARTPLSVLYVKCACCCVSRCVGKASATHGRCAGPPDQENITARCKMCGEKSTGKLYGGYRSASRRFSCKNTACVCYSKRLSFSANFVLA